MVVVASTAKQAKGEVANAVAANWVACAATDISLLTVKKFANCIAALADIILPATYSKLVTATVTAPAVVAIVLGEKTFDATDQRLLKALLADCLASSKCLSELLWWNLLLLEWFKIYTVFSWNN